MQDLDDAARDGGVLLPLREDAEVMTTICPPLHTCVRKREHPQTSPPPQASCVLHPLREDAEVMTNICPSLHTCVRRREHLQTSPPPQASSMSGNSALQAGVNP